MSAKEIRCDEESFENQFDFEKLYLQTRLSDVNFRFETGKKTAERVPAHKMLLSGQSDVFAAMFYGELKEKGDVTVTDASIDAFREFLQFFYLNRVNLTIENVAEVMNLGHKYNVTKCVDVCVRFLKGAVRDDSACVGLNLALLYDQPELQKRCETHISKHSDAVLKSKDFLECDKNALAHILQMNSLSCSETVVFEACMAWIKAKSKRSVVTKELIQEHLGELFYEIRFTSMKMEEFGALSMAHDYAFSLAEYKDIMHSFASSKKVSSKLFNENPRYSPWNEEAIIVCDRKNAASAMWHCNVSNNLPTTKFDSNRPILLGMLVFAPVSGQYSGLETELPINVKILEAADLSTADDGFTRTLADFNIQLLSQKETSITLPEPVFIRPGFYYEIRLVPEQRTDNYYRYYECVGLMANVQMENNTSIKFYGDRAICLHINSDRKPFVGLRNIITALGFNKL